MYLKKLKLCNFRNYKEISITFTKGINIFYGSNAQGKTNLLESIFVLGMTKSHRNFSDNNLIKINEPNLFIEGIIHKKTDNKINIYIDNKEKKLKYNNNSIKKISDYISIMNIIIFNPEDLNIIKGSPQNRRKFLNIEISQLYSNYYVLILEYNKILKLRNEYLKKINITNKVDREYLNILNNYLVDRSIKIYKLREKYLSKINYYCERIYKNIMETSGFNIKYKNCIEIDLSNPNIKQELLNKYSNKEKNDIKMCSTFIGPHKDDIEFNIGEKNLKYYGSQGQQRAAIIAFKLAEIEIFKNYKNETPILLLDDLFSELDDNKKNNLLKYISKDIQTIITTTELNNIDKRLIKKSKLFKIKDGFVKKIKEVNINE